MSKRTNDLGLSLNIERRIRAKGFMEFISVKKDKFYGLIKSSEIPEPIMGSSKDVFLYESVVKKEVEKYKDYNH